MKLQAERTEGTNAISRHSAEGVAINGREYTQSVIVPWRGEIAAWGPARFEKLTEAHFELLLPLKPELVLFGTGARLRFAKPALMRSLTDAGIGVETMDTPAACRTYNVLLGEARPVVAVLLFDGPA